jgi:TonB family protein
MAGTTDEAGRRDICRKILDTKPSLYARYFCDGYEAILQGRDRDAESALRGVLTEQPDFTLAIVLYGDAYASLNKFDLAEQYYHRAIDLQPQRIDARFSLGSLLLRRGQEEDPKFLPQALEAFRQMTEQEPDSPDGWGNMGLVLTYMGRYDDAEQMYKKALAKAPRDPFLYDNLAALDVRTNRNDDAEANWKRALGISPGYGPAVVELAALYARTDRLSRAIEILEAGRQAVRVPPWAPRIRHNLGFAYMQLGRMDSARERFKQATEEGSTDALSYLGLAHMLMLDGDAAGALPLFDQGAELDPERAAPFVRAWKAEIKTALKLAADFPALRKVLGAVESGGAVASQRKGAGKDSTAVFSATGAKATPKLVAYVLEGWSFRDAEKVKEEMRTSSPDSVTTKYDSAPSPDHQVPAEYPEQAQDAGITGVVQVMVTVDETGRVIDAKVVSHDSPEILNDAAVEAVRQWTFKPATRMGAPVRASIIVPFRFVRQKG